MKGVKEDLTGRRFGMLTVVKSLGSIKKYGRSYGLWLCRCDCGKDIEIITSTLKGGRVISCGCVRAKQLEHKYFKHQRIYNIWRGMKARCYNPKSPAYKYYGGRGITICKEWLDDFMTFCRWALANGYADDLSIDRIDVDGNYTPNNCRWADAITQANNQQRHKKNLNKPAHISKA